MPGLGRAWMGTAWRGGAGRGKARNFNDESEINVFESQTHKHPEWRRLLDEIGMQLCEGAQFSHEEISAMMGIDIRSSRGRTQFQKARRELIKVSHFWLENVFAKGYRVVKATEQDGCASRRLKQARRKEKLAYAIAAATDENSLTTPERRADHAQLLMLLHEIIRATHRTGRQVQKLAASMEFKQLPVGDVLHELEKPKKPKIQ